MQPTEQTPKLRPFAAILDRQAPWKGLSGASFGVASAYVVTLCAAVLLSSQAAPPAKRRPRSLVVTLFDAAKLSRMRVMEATGGAAPGVTGAASSAGPIMASAVANSSPTQHAMPQTAAPKSKPQQRAKPLPEAKRKEERGLAARSESQALAPTPPFRAPETSTQAAAAAPGPAANAGVAKGAQGGSAPPAHGTGTGTGTGVGSGTRPAITSGDTTVLPFMDGMTRPTVLSKVDPDYTREARDANVQGLILAKCVITRTGNLRNCRIVKGLPTMDQAVLRALSQWRYTPVLYQGKAVDVEYVIPVRLIPQ